MNVPTPPPAAVTLAAIEQLLEALCDGQVALLDEMRALNKAIGAQTDSKPSAWVENNSRGTTTGAKGYGERLADVVDDVARESKRLQVLASGSLAEVMRDD